MAQYRFGLRAVTLLRHPVEEGALVDENSTSYPPNHGIKAVSLREENEVSHAAGWRPCVRLGPLLDSEETRW